MYPSSSVSFDTELFCCPFGKGLKYDNSWYVYHLNKNFMQFVMFYTFHRLLNYNDRRRL